MLLALPALLLYAVFVLGPIGLCLAYSLTSWNGIAPEMPFVGLDNYAEAIGDPAVYSAFAVTAVIAVTATIVLNVLAIPMAVLLNRTDIVTRVYRSIVFFPIILAPLVVGLIWQVILNTSGILNAGLAQFGIGKTHLLADPWLAVASITFVTIWQTLGFTTVLYLAALQSIPDELYEAATIDGAGSAARFRHVTVPMLAPAITVNVVLLLIFFMRTYDYVVSMTSGGPGTATYTVAYLLIQRTFTALRYGYGSAIAIILLVVVSVLCGAVITVLRRREAVQ